ncbi:MAG: hypothetical protein J6P05_00825 [Lachnospiraceae bacterium]|nr:hypothetical protein [Lachnospiraceae bacterium]
MGLIGWIKNKFGFGKGEDLEGDPLPFGLSEDEEGGEGAEEVRYKPIRRSAINIHDSKDREEYIKSCCTQIVEATDEIEKATMEYRLVTNYLTDIEVVEKLPQEMRSKINGTAIRIVNLEKDTAARAKQGSKIPEEKYFIILKHEKEVNGDLERMRENEHFQGLIRSDLSKLESEKAVTIYRIDELRGKEQNARSMAILITAAGILTAVILAVLQMWLRFNTGIGYILLCAAAALSYTFLYVNFSNARQELRQKRNYLNAVIHKQNVVKIRYVNNTNLLDYEYRKYHVNHSDELEYFLAAFQDEKKARRFLEKADGEIGDEKRHLVKLLRTLNLNDPNIWVNQCEALVDPKEMVEIRHDLIQRRQAVRKRIEYNTENRDASKDEISGIAKEYPEYGEEILGIVSKYT